MEQTHIDLKIKVKEGEYVLENITDDLHSKNGIEFAVTFRFKKTFVVTRQSIKALTPEHLNKFVKSHCEILMKEANGTD